LKKHYFSFPQLNYLFALQASKINEKEVDEFSTEK
jgi:hypothetical protein